MITKDVDGIFLLMAFEGIRRGRPAKTAILRAHTPVFWSRLNYLALLAGRPIFTKRTFTCIFTILTHRKIYTKTTP